jgi:hypothetical protein
MLAYVACDPVAWVDWQIALAPALPLPMVRSIAANTRRGLRGSI